MEKNCSNCFWFRDYDCEKHCHYKTDKPIDFICDKFDYACKCGNEFATYEYEGELYCDDCIMEELDIETYTVTHYQSSDGEYLGNEEDDLTDILQKVDNDINEIQ